LEDENKRDCDKHLADGSWERYGFILKNPERIKSILAKGKLNFWDFELTAHFYWNCVSLLFSLFES